eukprot:6213991-Amphidinium_carterae.5
MSTNVYITPQHMHLSSAVPHFSPSTHTSLPFHAIKRHRLRPSFYTTLPTRLATTTTPHSYNALLGMTQNEGPESGTCA